MGTSFKLYPIGQKGLNVDADPLDMDDQELRLAQNVSRTYIGSGLRKRPGLTPANTSLATGPVLGGIGIPIINLHTSGDVLLFLGRGPS